MTRGTKGDQVFEGEGGYVQIIPSGSIYVPLWFQNSVEKGASSGYLIGSKKKLYFYGSLVNSKITSVAQIKE